MGAGRRRRRGRPPPINNSKQTQQHISTHLGEEGQDGDAGVAAHHGHIHLADVQAGLLGVEGLGADLQIRVDGKSNQLGISEGK